jgi:molybdopterin molybdotransferase
LLPSGADAVIPAEMTEAEGSGIKVGGYLAPGDNLIAAGSQFHLGQHLISCGSLLRPIEVSTLADLGYATATVYQRPKVVVLATGDELVELGGKIAPGQVFASNLYTLAILVNRCGGTVTSLAIVEDNLDVLTRRLERGMQAEMILTTGGTGRGEKDLISTAITSFGGDFFFRGVAMMPGKQTSSAQLDGTLLVSLPGRPSAARIAFEQLVRPVLLRMQGTPQVFLPEITASLHQPIQAKTKMLSFVHCRLTLKPQGPKAYSLRGEQRGRVAEMLAANALLKIPPERSRLEAGDNVRVQLLDSGLHASSYFVDDPG